MPCTPLAAARVCWLVSAAQTPVGVMLEILEDILNGQDIDVASVQQLHKLIVTGDFMSLVSVLSTVSSEGCCSAERLLPGIM